MVYRWIYYSIIETMKQQPKSMQQAIADFSVAMNNFNKAIYNVTMSTEKIKYAQLSKHVGRTVRNENQYDLALLGADQKTIDADIPAEAYRVAIGYGSESRLKEVYNTLYNLKPLTMKQKIKKQLKKFVAFLKTLPSAAYYAIHR